MKFKMLINIEIAKVGGTFGFWSPGPVICPASECCNATIVGILAFMSGINFMLGWAENERSFVSSGPSVHVSGTKMS